MASVEFKFDGTFDRLNDQLKEHLNVIERAKSEAKDLARAETSAFNQIENAQKGATENIKEQNKEQKKQEGILEAIKRKYNDLEKAANKATDINDIKEYRKEQKKLLDDLEKINKETAAIGSGGENIKQGFGGVGDFLKGQLLPLLAVGSAAEIARQTFERVRDISKQVRDAQGFAAQVTGTTGQELEVISSQARAISKTFDEDYKQVLIAANGVAKQFGITQGEALTLIEDGFVKGANAQGDFIDSLKEYPAQIALAGASAEEFVDILIGSQQQGIFSDKGIDAVKEFNLSIREQTTATADAVRGLLGEEAGDELLAGVRDGSISSVDALKVVSDGLNNTEVDAVALQTAIADIFKGAGEDAGLQYLQSLGGIIDGQIELSAEAQAYADKQRTILELNEELVQSENRVAGAFGETSQQLDILGLQAEIVLNDFLTSLIDSLQDVGENFRQVYAAFEPLIDGIVEFTSSITGGFSEAEGSVLSLGDILTNSLLGGIKILSFALLETVNTFKLLYVVGGEVIEGIGNLWDFAFSNLKATASDAINFIIEGLNNIPGVDIEQLAPTKREDLTKIEGSLGRIKEAFVDFGKQSGEDFKRTFLTQVEGIERETPEPISEDSIVSVQNRIAQLKQALREADPSDTALINALNEQLKLAEDKLDSVNKKIFNTDEQTSQTRQTIEIEPIEPRSVQQIKTQAEEVQLAVSEAFEIPPKTKDQLQEDFEQIQQLFGEFGGSLDAILGTRGFDNLFSSLTTFFSTDLPDGADKTVAKLQAVEAGIGVLGQGLAQANAIQIQQSQQLLDSIDEEIAAQEEKIDREKELKSEGLANSVESEEQALEILNQKREEAIEEQQKAQKRQAIIEAATQTGALATAAARLFADGALKGPAGIAVAGGLALSLLGIFSSFKQKAKGATTIAREGLSEVLGGALHTQGGVNLGHIEAERGEQLSIFNRKATTRHGSFLGKFTESINKGFSPMESIARLSPYIGDKPEVVQQLIQHHHHHNGRQEMEEMRRELVEIKKAIKNRPIIYSEGDIIEVNGNKTIIKKR